jgi:hypothetical protein
LQSRFAAESRSYIARIPVVGWAKQREAQHRI